MNGTIIARNESGWSWEYDRNDRRAAVYLDGERLSLKIVETHTKSGIGAGTTVKTLITADLGTLDKPDLGKVRSLLGKYSHQRTRAGYPFSTKWEAEGGAPDGPLGAIIAQAKVEHDRGVRVSPSPDALARALHSATPAQLRDIQRILRLAGRTAAAQYKTLNDAALVTGNEGYEPGRTEIWYKRPRAHRDLSFGWGFAEKHTPEALPDVKDLKKTHILVGRIDEVRLGKVYEMMQGEMWSPEGEARALISRLGLQHTSMSVGDIIRVGSATFFVDNSGFAKMALEAAYFKQAAPGKMKPQNPYKARKAYYDLSDGIVGVKYVFLREDSVLREDPAIQRTVLALERAFGKVKVALDSYLWD